MPRLNLFTVDLPDPRMQHDLFGTTKMAKSLARVLVQKLFN
jgi:hypothetical protein